MIAHRRSLFFSFLGRLHPTFATYSGLALLHHIWQLQQVVMCTHVSSHPKQSAAHLSSFHISKVHPQRVVQGNSIWQHLQAI